MVNPVSEPVHGQTSGETPSNTNTAAGHTHLQRVPTLREREELAAYEGHDADIASNLGIVTPEEAAAAEISEKDKHLVKVGSHDQHDLEKGSHSGSAATTDETAVDETPRDPHVVTWDGPDDPANPLNWSKKLRWGHVAVISSITFITPLASSMFAPGVPALMVEFGSSNTMLAAFVVSVYVLGFAIGPIIIGPLSELYGRLWVYHACNALFIIFTIACAVSSNLNMLIGFRFLEGCAGSAPLTLGGGTIADVIPQERRGGAMALMALGPLMGPVIGPVAGGFLAQAKGWRWVFWLLTIISGTVSISAFITLRETYGPTILSRKAKKLRKETGDEAYQSAMDKGMTPRQLFKAAIIRPTKMLFLSPIVFSLSLFMAIVYGYLYLLFTTFPVVFEDQYGFSSGTVGLTYLGIGIGSFLAVIVFGYWSDRLLKSKSAKGEMKPEYRLPPMIYGAPTIPIGLFWYGWSAEAQTHWIVPIIGTLFVGLGMLSAFMPVMTYVVDAFTLHAASAMAATTVLRSIFGAVLPLAGQKMYAKLGLGWGNSLLAFIALALCPIPLVLYRYGEYLRLRFKLNL